MPAGRVARKVTAMNLSSRTTGVILGCTLALFWTGAAAAQDRGATLVQRHCGGCHAVGPGGVSPEPAAPPFRDLHLRYDPEMLAEALAEGLLTGHSMMPEFRFEPHDVRAIILYLKSIQPAQAG